MSRSPTIVRWISSVPPAIELAGTEEKLEAFTELLKPYGIEELARTGVIAMARGMQTAKDKAAATTGGSKPRVRSLSGPASQAPRAEQ